MAAPHAQGGGGEESGAVTPIVLHRVSALRKQHQCGMYDSHQANARVNCVHVGVGAWRGHCTCGCEEGEVLFVGKREKRGEEVVVQRRGTKRRIVGDIK